MFVRVTTVKVKSDKTSEMVSIYHSAIMPEVKQAKGNIDVLLLEPVTGNDDYISITLWDSEANAQAYESSGQYKAMVDKVRHTFAAAPTLKNYEARK